MTLPSRVIAACAAAYGVPEFSVTDLSSHSKTVMRARRAASYILHVLLQFSSTETAAHLGYATTHGGHTPVLANCRKIRASKEEVRAAERLAERIVRVQEEGKTKLIETNACCPECACIFAVTIEIQQP